MSTVADPRDIIIAPVVSEKSYSELNKNWYTFEVHPDANKTAIKIAIQQIFDVKVETVNPLNRQGKRKRTKTGWGKRKDIKRPIVKLPDGDGAKRYIIAPNDLKQGDRVESGPGADIKPGNNLPLRNIPVGTTIHAVELRPGGGAKLARSAGVGIQLLGRESDYATLRMPSGEIRRVLVQCRATVGEIGNADQSNISWGKAGRMRWKGKRPSVRGVAMNPIDHPHGGGEGKTSGGRHPVNPKGKPEGRTRKAKQPSDKLIVRRRYANRKRG